MVKISVTSQTQINSLAFRNAESQESYQQKTILNRKEARNYQTSLKPENNLYSEINHILACYHAGIHQLSNGQKINATRVRLLGGGKTLVSNAISAVISSKQKTKSFRYQAPPGKYIVKYSEVKLEGQEKDIEKVTTALHHYSANSSISQKDTELWEREAEVSATATIAAISPADIGFKGALKKNDQKVHEETYSNQTLVLEIEAKRRFYESDRTIKATVDVWIDDIPEKKEVLAKELIATISGATSLEGGVSANAGSEIAFESTVEKVTKVETRVEQVQAKRDILANSNIPKVATSKQMEDSVAIGTLRSEIDRITAEIDKLKEEKTKALDNYNKNKSDDFLSDEYKNEAKNIAGKIKEAEARKKDLEVQIDSIIKK